MRDRAAAALRDLIAVQWDLDNDLTASLQAADKHGPRPPSTGSTGCWRSSRTWRVARSKLGTLYAATGQLDRAVPHLEAVARGRPETTPPA